MAKIRVNENTTVFRKTDILSSNIDNEVVLLNVGKSEYTGLDEVATDIWNELESPILVKELVTRIMGIYSVEEKKCTEEIVEFVKELIASGLVEIVDDKE